MEGNPVEGCTQTGKFTLCGDGLCVGYDSADAIFDYGTVVNPTCEVEPTYPFKGGEIKEVVITPLVDVQLLPIITPQGAVPAEVQKRLFAGAFAAD